MPDTVGSSLEFDSSSPRVLLLLRCLGDIDCSPAVGTRIEELSHFFDRSRNSFLDKCLKIRGRLRRRRGPMIEKSPLVAGALVSSAAIWLCSACA
mmetsp:Transcript_40869/g.81962  ORF Transcript_40869/g.81962 Transcript_40869/m.81962 type:complete len:95 (-) Transcript_40869:211-495(-)